MVPGARFGKNVTTDPVPCEKCIRGQHRGSQYPVPVRFPLRVSRLGTCPATIADMLFFLLAHVWAVLLDLMWLGRRSRQDNDLEILLLRQHLRIRQRKQLHAPRISQWEKRTLVVRARNLITMTNIDRGWPGHARVQARHADDVAP